MLRRSPATPYGRPRSAGPLAGQSRSDGALGVLRTEAPHASGPFGGASAWAPAFGSQDRSGGALGAPRTGGAPLSGPFGGASAWAPAFGGRPGAQQAVLAPDAAASGERAAGSGPFGRDSGALLLS